MENEFYIPMVVTSPGCTPTYVGLGCEADSMEEWQAMATEKGFDIKTGEHITPVSGNLTIELNVECPHCDHYHDLFDDANLTDEGYLYELLLDGTHFGTTDEILTTTCSGCKMEFNVTCKSW